jgi:hypothetical protein
MFFHKFLLSHFICIELLSERLLHLKYYFVKDYIMILFCFRLSLFDDLIRESLTSILTRPFSLRVSLGFLTVTRIDLEIF